MTDAEFRARYLDWQLTDEECRTFNAITIEYNKRMEEVFGTRAEIVLANSLGGQLARLLSETTTADSKERRDDTFFIMSTINDWLDITAINHGGQAFRLIFVEDAPEELQ